MAKVAKKETETPILESDAPSTAVHTQGNEMGKGTTGAPEKEETKPAAAKTSAPPPEAPKNESKAGTPDGLPRPVTAPPAPTNKKFVGNFLACRKEQMCMTYQIYPEDGVTVEDVVDPAYWANVTRLLRPNSRIEVLFQGEDPRWLDLLVVDLGDLWAKVKILANVSLLEAQQEALGLKLKDATANHKVKYRGGVQKWVVERIKDKAILAEGLNSETDALKWERDYSASLKR